MKFNNFFLFFIVLLITASCSKNEVKKSLIKEKSLELQVLDAYQEGMNSLLKGDVLFAAKKFNEAELLFPQSIWAPKASLMAAYAYYTQDYYGDSIAELERFIKIYSKNINIDYAYYLLAVCFYEQIIDEKKDLQSMVNSKKYFEFVIKNYPKTTYAMDSEFKIGFINEMLAAKEMYVGRYYFDKKKWIPAINRFKTVINDYNTTIYAEEALHRLVEVHYTIGLKNEAKKYAKLLGYNYQSSRWYEQSYTIFNKNYEKVNNRKKKKRSTLKKIKSLFE